MTPDELRKLIAEARRADAEARDPRNPWPSGSEWHRMHNEMYRRQQARRRAANLLGGGDG